MDMKTWRANRQVEMALPSGLVVTLRRVSLVDIVANGQLPAPLIGLVQELVDNATSGVKPKIDLADFPDYGKVVEVGVRAAIVSPPLVETSELAKLTGDDRVAYLDSHLDYDDLDWDDRTAIFNRVSKGAKEIAPFPQQPGSGQAGLDRESSVPRDATVPIPGTTAG